MKWIRNLFFANWRNKAIALFFALSIWFVAYQSETKEYSAPIRVKFRPADAATTVIMSVAVEDDQNKTVPFDDEVRVSFTGQRKQVDRLRDNLKREQELLVPAGVTRYEFTSEDFGYPRDGVSIASVDPSAVRIEKEPLAKKAIDLKATVELQNPPPSYQLDERKVSVKPESVSLRGPQSLVDQVVVSVPLRYEGYGESVEGAYSLEVRAKSLKDKELVDRLVKIQDPDGNWVELDTPTYVQVRAPLKVMDASLEAKVRFMFRVKPTENYLRFTVDNLPGDTIPVTFSGPKDEIERLRARIQEPRFALIVRPPANFNTQEGGTFPLTEDDLELIGFPGVSIAQPKPLSYRVRVLPQQEGKE